MLIIRSFESITPLWDRFSTRYHGIAIWVQSNSVVTGYPFPMKKFGSTSIFIL